MQLKLTFLLLVPLLLLLTEAQDMDNTIDLQASSDEAIGDRIMEEMNGMKEEFDVALNRIDEEIRKDEEEQDELKLRD